MEDEFFQQLLNCIEKEGRRLPGHTVSAKLYQELMRDIRPDMVSAAKPSSALRNSAARPVTGSTGQSGNMPRRPSPVDTPHIPVAGPALPVNSPLPGASVKSLVELQQLAQNCTNCRLSQNRQSVVFGEGNPQAQLMFISDAPSPQDEIQGRPFVGAAGELLTKMIQAMQFTREEIYIANIVKCCTPGNRNPEPDEAFACIGLLKMQIELVRPKAIVLLGACALRFLLERTESFMRLRGKWLAYNGIPVMPTFHPAYLLRDPAGKKLAWADLQQVMKMFGKVHKTQNPSQSR